MLGGNYLFGGSGDPASTLFGGPGGMNLPPRGTILSYNLSNQQPAMVGFGMGSPFDEAVNTATPHTPFSEKDLLMREVEAQVKQLFVDGAPTMRNLFINNADSVLNTLRTEQSELFGMEFIKTIVLLWRTTEITVAYFPYIAEVAAKPLFQKVLVYAARNRFTNSHPQFLNPEFSMVNRDVEKVHIMQELTPYFKYLGSFLNLDYKELMVKILKIITINIRIDSNNGDRYSNTVVAKLQSFPVGTELGFNCSEERMAQDTKFEQFETLKKRALAQNASTVFHTPHNSTNVVSAVPPNFLQAILRSMLILNNVKETAKMQNPSSNGSCS